MKPMQIITLAVAGAFLGALAGVGWQQWEERRGALTAASTDAVHEVLPEFSYADLRGQERTRREWPDKILVVNFWASWCPPCREEMPLFVELQQEYGSDGVQFVGIAIDDPEPVQAFVDELALNYPTLLGDMAAVELSRRLGNRFGGLPFTIVTRPDGRIVLRHSGELRRERLEPLLQSLLTERDRA
jgi:thiol-disulfide isomerase/thioredoxin